MKQGTKEDLITLFHVILVAMCGISTLYYVFINL